MDSKQRTGWLGSESIYMPSAPFTSSVLQSCRETLPSMQPSDKPQPVPVAALHLPSSRSSQTFTRDINFTFLEELLRNPAAVSKLDPVEAVLHRCVDGQHALVCRNQSPLVELLCIQAVHLGVVLKIKCVVREAVDESFLGEWEDNDNSYVTVRTKARELVASVRKERKPDRHLSVRVDLHGRWICGDGVWQPDESTPNQIVWQSDCGVKRRVWRRPADYILHPPLMQRMQSVQRFCEETVPSLRPSRKPVRVPVGALRFTQYNINKNLQFFDRKRMLDMLEERMRAPTSVEKLEPFDVFLYTGPDGVLALYSRNNRRLLVLRCLQAIHGDVLMIKCRIHDAESSGLSPNRKTTFRDWFRSGYSKLG